MHDYKNIVILTGAGISRESGIHTFRDADGIWANVNVEDVATPQGFRHNPARVHDFYNARRRQLLSGTVQPNAAHKALARFEQERPGNLLIITQNVDNLHESAGSKNLIHMHGELLKSLCGHCHHVAECTSDLSIKTTCTQCHTSGKMRPHVVWFGEMPLYPDETTDALRECDLFISIGTSGNVYPAANFVEEAKRAGAHTVELNLEKSLGASSFHEAFYGPATEVVPDYFRGVPF